MCVEVTVVIGLLSAVVNRLKVPRTSCYRFAMTGMFEALHLVSYLGVVSGRVGTLSITKAAVSACLGGRCYDPPARLGV